MVKFFLKRDKGHQKKSASTVSQSHTENADFYVYIEYEGMPSGTDSSNLKCFSAIQNANFSGRGFLEVIHPALNVHQIRCSRNQIKFGVVFKLEKGFDIDSRFMPEAEDIVWKLNIEKYSASQLIERIADCPPHKVRISPDS